MAAMKPNILLIMTDQQRADAMNCAGNRDVHTPAMDWLAAGGTRFEFECFNAFDDCRLAAAGAAGSAGVRCCAGTEWWGAQLR